MGIVTAIKGFAPIILYSSGIILMFVALSGKPEWLLSLLVVLFPLRNVYDKLSVFPLGNDFFDLSIIILLISMVARSMKTKDKIFTKSPVNFMVILIIFYTFLTLIQGSIYLGNDYLFSLADKRVHSWKNFCILPILYLIVLNVIRDKKWVWRIVMVICATMILMNYYLVQQILWFSNISSRIKIHGTFVNLGPNEVAAFYTQYTIILMGIYFGMKKGRNKLILLSIIVTNIFCVLFLFSRSSYIALAIGLFLIFSFKKRLLLIPLILIGIFWKTALPDKMIERVEMTTDAYGQLDKSSVARLRIWEASLDLFSENPISGVGYGVFRYLHLGLADTHNIYLKLLAEQGIIGIFIFLLLLFILFIQGIKLSSGGADDREKGMGLGFAICIIVLMVNNVFGNRWTYVELSAYFWVFAALITRLNILSAEKSS